mgnify:CR=1 FL=1
MNESNTMNKDIEIEMYLQGYSLKAEEGDKVIRKDNEPFKYPGSFFDPIVAEYIGKFNDGSKLWAIIRTVDESGGFNLGYVDPEELYLV